jgi:WXG100 protein secretion system (Wss), protein YukD
MPSATDAAYCRLTLLAPRTRVDLALPADMAVAELIPMIMELIGEPVAGRRPQPWRLYGVVGGTLPSNRSLRDLGVLDGEVLRIAPAGAGPAPPIFDDPVDALAATARVATAGDQWLRVVAALLLITAAAGLLAGWSPPDVTSMLVGRP